MRSSARRSSSPDNPSAPTIPLAGESVFSASVTLVPAAEGKVTVHKSAVGYGIDGNGASWLSLFLGASHAVMKTGMFMAPAKVLDSASDITLVLPYTRLGSF